MNTKMSIKSIVLFEKMTNIPFSEMSFSEQSILSNPEVFLKLLYCILISHPENKVKCTFEAACESLFTEQSLMLYSTELSTEIAIMNQFVDMQKLRDVNDVAIKETKENEEPKPVYMKNLVPILVLDCGLDIDYVLNEMSYTDIDDYFKYREDKHRNDLEEKRLFTFLSVLPHINSKKVKSPEKFYPFPWEKEMNKKRELENMKKVRQKLIDAGIIQGKS